MWNYSTKKSTCACWTRVVLLHSDILLFTQTSWAQVGFERNNSHPCAQRSLHPFCVVFHICMAAEPVFLNWDIDLFLILRYWDIEWRWQLLKSRCSDANLTSSRHRWSTSTVIKHCDERSSVGTRWSRENDGTVGVETVPRGHESWKARAVRTWQRLWRLDFTFNGYAGTLDPTYLALLKTARQSPKVVMATPPRTAVCNIAVPPHDAHTETITVSGEKTWKQRFRSVRVFLPYRKILLKWLRRKRR